MSEPASARCRHPQPGNARVGTQAGAASEDMQELHRLLWSTYPVRFSELPSAFQTLPSKQRTIQGTLSPAITRPVLNSQYHRIPGAIFSVFTTKLLCMVLFQLSSSQVCSLSVYYLKTMKTFMLTEFKTVFVDLWIAHFLQCTNSSSFHLLTLFPDAGVGLLQCVCHLVDPFE